MPRRYKVPYTGTLSASGTDSDLLSVQPATNKPCRIAGWIMGQTSELGDAQEEGIRITLRHMVATVTIGSGGSSVTPVPVPRPTVDTAAGFTARCNDTTVATTNSTSTICEEMAWNERSSPWERWIPEEDRMVAINGEALIVRAENTLADDITICMFFIVEEMT